MSGTGFRIAMPSLLRTLNRPCIRFYPDNQLLPHCERRQRFFLMREAGQYSVRIWKPNNIHTETPPMHCIMTQMKFSWRSRLNQTTISMQHLARKTKKKLQTAALKDFLKVCLENQASQGGTIFDRRSRRLQRWQIIATHAQSAAHTVQLLNVTTVSLARSPITH